MELPVIIHSRGMIDLVIKQLRKKKIKGGIIHAFNGSFQQAEHLINLGFKLDLVVLLLMSVQHI